MVTISTRSGCRWYGILPLWLSYAISKIHNTVSCSLSATMVTTLWLKQPICFCYAFTDCHMTGSCMSHDWFLTVTWLVPVCHMTVMCCIHSHVARGGQWPSLPALSSLPVPQLFQCPPPPPWGTSSPVYLSLYHPPLCACVCVWEGEEREGRDKGRRGRRCVYMEGTVHTNIVWMCVCDGMSASHTQADRQVTMLYKANVTQCNTV